MNIPKIKPVNLTNKTEFQFNEAQLEELFYIVINGELKPTDSFVNLELSDDGSIRELNRKYLGRDELTDVLSFTAEVPGINLIGDIIIDITVADSQKDDRELDQELLILFLHGLLHCLGYDHLSVMDKKIMDAKEEKYMILFQKEIN